MKPILPTLKEKKRYLTYEVLSKEKSIKFNSVKNAIENTLKKFLGELNLAKAGVIIMDDFSKKQRGIIRVNNKYTNQLKAALTFINSINGSKALIHSITSTGMLNKARAQL